MNVGDTCHSAQKKKSSNLSLSIRHNDNDLGVQVSNDEQIMMRMYSKEKSGQDHITAPTFTICPEMATAVTLGDWHLVQPVVK